MPCVRTPDRKLSLDHRRSPPGVAGLLEDVPQAASIATLPERNDAGLVDASTCLRGPLWDWTNASGLGSSLSPSGAARLG